nr:unnamed protein product [Digitaria exilis]
MRVLRHGRPPGVGDHHAVVDGAVVLERGADGGLPVDGVAAGVRLDARQVRVLHVGQQARPLAEVAEQHVPDDLRRAFAPLPQRLRVRRQLEDEAVLAPHLLLPDAPSIGEQPRRRERVEALERAAEGADGALGGVGAEPRGVAPDEAAVAAGADLAAADGKLHRTNPPCSTAGAPPPPEPRFFTTRVAVSNSDATIRTLPMA